MKMCYCEVCNGQVPARGEIMKIEQGDTIEHRGTGRRYKVLLVLRDWICAESSTFDRPTIFHLSALKAAFKLVAPFEVGDVVEYIIAPTGTTFKGEGKVLALHEDRAWVWFEGRTVPLSPLVTTIQKVKGKTP